MWWEGKDGEAPDELTDWQGKPVEDRARPRRPRTRTRASPRRRRTTRRCQQVLRRSRRACPSARSSSAAAARRRCPLVMQAFNWMQRRLLRRDARQRDDRGGHRQGRRRAARPDGDAARSAATTWASTSRTGSTMQAQIGQPAEDLPGQLVPQGQGRQVPLAGLRREHARPQVDRRPRAPPRRRAGDAVRLGAQGGRPRSVGPRHPARAGRRGDAHRPRRVADGARVDRRVLQDAGPEPSQRCSTFTARLSHERLKIMRERAAACHVRVSTDGDRAPSSLLRMSARRRATIGLGPAGTDAGETAAARRHHDGTQTLGDQCDGRPHRVLRAGRELLRLDGPLRAMHHRRICAVLLRRARVRRALDRQRERRRPRASRSSTAKTATTSSTPSTPRTSCLAPQCRVVPLDRRMSDEGFSPSSTNRTRRRSRASRRRLLASRRGHHGREAPVLALKNELEATECAAGGFGTTREIDVKLALARQAGDEAKHYRLIEKRLAELGVDASAYESRAAVAAPAVPGVARDDGRARRRRAVHARGARRRAKRGVRALLRGPRATTPTAALYRDVIQPDERHHHELGRHAPRRAGDDARRARVGTRAPQDARWSSPRSSRRSRASSSASRERPAVSLGTRSRVVRGQRVAAGGQVREPRGG